jgi:hypothetical protein
MSKKKNKATMSGNLPALKIGSRVRCTDDGVEGRIVWANAVSVKIEWTDGEKVTWRRDALATKPIEIIDPDADEQPATDVEPNTEQSPVPTTAEPTAAPEETPEEQPTTTPEVPSTEPIANPPAPEASPEAPHINAESATTDGAAPEPLSPFGEAITWNVLDALPDSEAYLKVIGTVTALTLGDAQAAAKALYATPHIVQAPEAPEATVEQATPDAANATAQTPAKPKRQRKAAAEPKEKKPSALDAAARVLAEEGRPMTCQEMIAAMAAKGYWTSPGGRTPSSTLYSAILREIDTKTEESSSWSALTTPLIGLKMSRSKRFLMSMADSTYGTNLNAR